MASVYVGVVGSANEMGVCRDSIHNIRLRTGDFISPIIRGTKGYEARQAHVNRFLKSQYGALMFLDGDMVFEPDNIERLRSHGLPFVSGYYMRRQFKPIAPVWFKSGDGWPMMPWMTEPKRGQLHKLGASGWGDMLVHREVFTAVEPVLKGEWFIAEDDMDIWPYDLKKVMGAIRTLKTEYGKSFGTDPQCVEAIKTLAKEIRPLRGQFDGDMVGSDLRFPFYAKSVGYQLMGDPDVRPGHMLDYPLSPDDYTLGGQTQAVMIADTKKHVAAGRKAHKARLKEL